MTIDERARQAATDLLERAAERTVPAVHDLEVPRRRGARPLLAAVAAVVLAVVGIAVFAGSDDDAPPAMPGGGRSRTWAPAGLGLSVQIPSTWLDRGPAAGFSYTASPAGGDGSIVADRFRALDPQDASAVGTGRRTDLRAFGAIDVELATTEVDGRPAAVLRYHLSSPDGPGTYAITEYDVPVGDWVLIVAIGERDPADRSELTEWVASTIEVGDPSDISLTSPLEQPTAPLPVPAGVEATTWSPEDMGVSLQVPTDWREERVQDARYRLITVPGGGPVVSVTRITTSEAASRREDIEYEGGVIESEATTTVDGRRATVLRYWRPAGGYPLRADLCTELLVHREDGSVLMVLTAEHDGEDRAELLRWIRSTIRLT